MRNLRKIYGRSGNGISNRRVIKITLTPETFERIKDHVEFGKGKSGSAFIELSVELMLAIIGDGTDIEDLTVKINNTIESPIAVARNLRLLSSYIEA